MEIAVETGQLGKASMLQTSALGQRAIGFSREEWDLTGKSTLQPQIAGTEESGQLIPMAVGWHFENPVVIFVYPWRARL